MRLLQLVQSLDAIHALAALRKTMPGAWLRNVAPTSGQGAPSEGIRPPGANPEADDPGGDG